MDDNNIGSLISQSVDENCVDSLISEDNDFAGKSLLDAASDDVQPEISRKYLLDPEYQAAVVYENYVNSHILSGQQKRKLRREVLHNAKKGKYMRMFKAEYDGTAEARRTDDFNKLNA